MDLTLIRERVARKNPDIDVQLAEQMYREFFTGYNGKGLVHPLVDLFWHEHILDTRKYQEDCQEVFGAFLHHIPGRKYCAGAMGKE